MIIPGKVGMATLPKKIIKLKEKLPMLFYPTISRIFISHMKKQKASHEDEKRNSSYY